MARSPRLARAASRLDRLAGRMVWGAFGLVALVPALAAGSGALAAVQEGAWGSALLMGAIAAAFGGFAAWCLSPRRRLSEVEP